MPENDPTSLSYRFGDFELFPRDRLLLRAGKRVSLTPRAFDVLVKLITAEGHVVTKDELLRDVWADVTVEEGNLNRTVSTLRKQLEESRGENRFIQTIPKSGYRFVAEVESVDSHDPAPIVNGNGQGAGITSDLGTRRREYMFAAIALATLAGLVAAAYFLFAKKADLTRKADLQPQMLRLTNNNFDEDAAEWTFDNKIRFLRYVTRTRAESWVMNADGSDQHRANDEIKDLITGQWSPDGKQVVFVKENEGPSIVYLANADGSNERKLPLNFPPNDWSPDGTKFVYTSKLDRTNSEIFIYDLATEKSTNISNSPAFDADPLFSSDGSAITFVSDRDGNAEAYLMNVDGTAVRRLTENPAVDAFPLLSPDGTQVVFDSNRDGENTDIYVRNLNDDRPPVKLTDLPSNEEHRRDPWSPDGTRLVITSDQSGKSNIYVLDAETITPQIFANDDKADLQYPAVAADGSAVVYQARTNDTSLELRVSQADGSSSRSIFRTEPVAANLVMTPAIASDGSRIAFTNRIEGNTEVCIINIDGTGFENLTRNAAADASPFFSPDGSEIYFQSNRDGAFERFHIFKMKTDGTEPGRVLKKEGYEFSPKIFNGGASMVFSGDRPDDTSRALDIRLADLRDTANEKVIAQRRFHDTQPAVSPDGQRIAFVAQSDGNSEIYLCNIDGSGLVRLTRNAGEDISPVFSADGKTLLFSSNRGGRFAIYRIDLNF